MTLPTYETPSPVGGMQTVDMASCIALAVLLVQVAGLVSLLFGHVNV